MSETPNPGEPVPTPAVAAAASALPPENRLRGTLLTLPIIPAGVIVWAIVAAIGYISGIVGLGIAIGALALYRLGSGGRISFNGAARVSAIVLGTLVLSFIAGIVVPNASYFSRAAQSGRFFEALSYSMTLGGGDTVINVLLALLFAALGVFTIFRTAATQAKQEQAAAQLPPAA